MEDSKNNRSKQSVEPVYQYVQPNRDLATSKPTLSEWFVFNFLGYDMKMKPRK